MSTIIDESETHEELSEDKQSLLKKLSTIFDHDTAVDFVCPKTYETRKHLTIEDLKHVNYEPPEERLQRLRSLEHYQTTTQSLSRADLEASYQAFVRGQVGQQQYSRGELEQFVRNSSDIDAAKRYLDFAHDTTANPLQSHLLYHSSKLNEHRATLLKSASSTRSLKQMNDDLTLQNYFPQTLTTHSKTSHKQKEILDTKRNILRPRLMHVEQGEKKYRITFLKDTDRIQLHHRTPHHSSNNRRLHTTEHRNIEELFDNDNSTVHGLSTGSNTSNIHREIFPPLSLSALTEYRPTLTPKVSSASTTQSQKQQQHQRRKPTEKTDFIWEQSIVTPRNE